MSATPYTTRTALGVRFGLDRIARLTGDVRGEHIGEKAEDAIAETANLINARLRSRYPDLSVVDATDPYLADLNTRAAYLMLERDKPMGWGEDEERQWNALMDELDDLASGKATVQLTQGATPYGGMFKANKRVFGREVAPC